MQVLSCLLRRVFQRLVFRGLGLPLNAMILRRASRTDPRLVLGSALAFVLPLGANLAAFARFLPAGPAPLRFHRHRVPSPSVVPAPARRQNPISTCSSSTTRSSTPRAPSSARPGKARPSSSARSRRSAPTGARSTSELIDTAARVRDVEEQHRDDAGAPRSRSTSEERIFQTSLEGRRGVIVEVLAALQRLGRQPPRLLVRPEDMLEAVRTSMLLGAVLPELRAETEALASDLAELVRLKEAVATERDNSRGRCRRPHQRAALASVRRDALVDARQKPTSLWPSGDAAPDQALKGRGAGLQGRKVSRI